MKATAMQNFSAGTHSLAEFHAWFQKWQIRLPPLKLHIKVAPDIRHGKMDIELLRICFDRISEANL